MFSKRAINDLTSRLIYPMVEKLCRHLDNFCDTQTPVPFDNATYCVTVDIITAYVSGTPWNMLDEPGFDTERLDSVRWFTGGSNVAICFPWTRRAVQFLNWCFPAMVLEGYTQMFRVGCHHLASPCLALTSLPGCPEFCRRSGSRRCQSQILRHMEGRPKTKICLRCDVES
jgi:hypothetical protein